MKVFVDLFAGLGGASQAFVDDEEWVVIRLDNNPELLEHCPDLIMCDLTDLDDALPRIRERMPADPSLVVVWASPPCLEFSNAFSSPRSVARRNGEPFQPDMKCFEAALDLVDRLNPDFWLLENVRGASSFFSPIIGPPRQIIGSFFLWGQFPFLSVHRDDERIVKDDKRWSPIRANIKAKVPMAYSRALKRTLESQRTLFDY